MKYQLIFALLIILISPPGNAQSDAWLQSSYNNHIMELQQADTPSVGNFITIDF